MKLSAFAVRDIKASGFAHPFFATTEGLARRSFADWCNDPNTPLSRHPEDYQLFQVGYFDDETGQLTSTNTPELLLSGSNCIEQRKERT